MLQYGGLPARGDDGGGAVIGEECGAGHDRSRHQSSAIQHRGVVPRAVKPSARGGGRKNFTIKDGRCSEYAVGIGHRLHFQCVNDEPLGLQVFYRRLKTVALPVERCEAFCKQSADRGVVGRRGEGRVVRCGPDHG